MTERLGALAAIAFKPDAAREHALEAFGRRYAMEPLILDKWFGLQALIPERETLDRVRALMNHRGFSLANPNRVRALIGGFTANQTQFNRPDGAGFALLEEVVRLSRPDQSSDRRAAFDRDAVVALARGGPPRPCRSNAEADRRPTLAVAGCARHRDPEPRLRRSAGPPDSDRRFSRGPRSATFFPPAPVKGLDKDSHKDSYRSDSGVKAAARV